MLEAFVKTIIENGVAWIWIVILAMWGGTVRYIIDTRNKGAMFNIKELFGDWIISGFSGLVAAYIGIYYLKLESEQAYAFAGIGGHWGARLLFLLEKKARHKFFKKSGEDHEQK